MESPVTSISVHPNPSEIGAEVTGVDLSGPLSAEAVSTITEAFGKYRILLFTGQSITVEQQIAFSQIFGALEEFPTPEDRAEGYRTVLRVTNIERDTGKIKSLDDPVHRSFTLGTSSWHIDSSFRMLPSAASFLYAIEIPDDGGDTMFADTTLAYASLSEKQRTKLDTLVVLHDFAETRRRHNLPPRSLAVQNATPPVRHPLVAARPNGSRALFIGSHAAGIEGMSYKDARLLLDDLEKAATMPQFTYRHQWQPGELIMYDNICVMHQAMPYDLTGARRLLHRTTIAGTSNLVGTRGPIP